MKRTVFDHERVGRWVCERLNCQFDKTSSAAIGIERDGELVGGVFYDNFRTRCIAMHVASAGAHWMTMDFLWYAFAYPFQQLGVSKVMAPIDSTNTNARHFVERLGFVLEASIAEGSKDGDLLIYTMNRAQCRFLKGK